MLKTTEVLANWRVSFKAPTLLLQNLPKLAFEKHDAKDILGNDAQAVCANNKHVHRVLQLRVYTERAASLAFA